MTESREFCESCQRWLEHDQRMCPLFPDVGPGTRYGPGTTPLKKWTRCMCLVHTCYVAEKCNRATAPTYRDFMP
ncbi:hypothetical protein LCGC14_1492840 [marine sediment metagenome]|uniref:Uncharacterized protein n=1 Tax=marine sediment metagenome TaxID=412755 RepID=A0A0F9JS88_9ZZZZ